MYQRRQQAATKVRRSGMLLVAVLAVVAVCAQGAQSPPPPATGPASPAVSPAAPAEKPAPPTPPPCPGQQPNDKGPAGPLDRLIFTVGVLIVISQATERMMLLLRKLLGHFGLKWAETPSAAAAQDPQQAGARSTLLNTYSLAVGLFVAFASRVSTLDMLRSGQVTPVTWPFPSAGAWAGIALTGFIASMGSAFLNDLLAVLKATKDLRRAAFAATNADTKTKQDGQADNAPPPAVNGH